MITSGTSLLTIAIVVSCWRESFALLESVMAKKVLIGMFAVFTLIGVAAAGYKFGQFLAQEFKHSSQTSESSSA